VVHVEKIGNARVILFEQPEQKKTVCWFSYRWVDDTKTELKERRWGGGCRLDASSSGQN
jgi:hypothetical protein